MPGPNNPRPGGSNRSLERVVIVSGMGGSGKTTALHALEDIGFYCIDNLPLVLFKALLDRLEPHPEISRVALVVDIRDRLFLEEAPQALLEIIAAGIPTELLFLDAEDDVLLRRYKETRRRHPLESHRPLRNAIEEERRMLEALLHLANLVIDTSSMSPHALRRCLDDRFEGGGLALRVSVMSFGFKYGVPAEADLVFDVRFLANPFFVPHLRTLCGLDPPLRDYVFADPKAQIFVDKAQDFVGFLLPNFAAEGKRYVTIAIGCTGGQHRSVAIAEACADVLERGAYTVRRVHRDMRPSNQL